MPVKFLCNCFYFFRRLFGENKFQVVCYDFFSVPNNVINQDKNQV